MGTFDALLREALFACALIAFPVLGSAMLVGTIVAVLQAATQIQEQTLTLLPKILVVALLVVFFGHAAFEMLGHLFTDAARQLPLLARAA